jgi:adenosine deaminase
MTEDAKQTRDALHQQLKTLPKIELHRHLEGSLRLETLSELARTHFIGLPHEIEALRPHVQIMNGDPADLRHFLEKFNALRRFYRSPEIIDRVAYEAIADCAADNIKYLELRFTPRALAATMDYALEDVSDWVVAAAERAAEEFGITVKLIVSMNRHESVALGERVADIAVDLMGHGVVGLDLAGNEASFPATPFAPIFREAKQAGLKITVHAGEWAGPENVREAIEDVEADRLGHGVRVVQDASIVRMARERDIAFEVCVTSNVQSGSVKNVEQHPLRELYHLSLLTTINTDDPGVSDITLTDEMVVAMRDLDLTLDDVKNNILNAAQVAFLPSQEGMQLVTQFREDLFGLNES